MIVWEFLSCLLHIGERSLVDISPISQVFGTYLFAENGTPKVRINRYFAQLLGFRVLCSAQPVCVLLRNDDNAQLRPQAGGYGILLCK